MLRFVVHIQACECDIQSEAAALASADDDTRPISALLGIHDLQGIMFLSYLATQALTEQQPFVKKQAQAEKGTAAGANDH